MTRAEFSRKTMLAAWDRAKGCCENCGRKLFPGDRKEYDHVIPCELGGTNDPGNCQLLCVLCHKAKTATDQRTFAKARSVRAKNIGAHKPKAVLPGSRASGLKKKINGETVRREE